jgi:hypothetical protein
MRKSIEMGQARQTRGNSHKKSPIRKRELIIAIRILYIIGNKRNYCSKFCGGVQMQHKAQTEHFMCHTPNRKEIKRAYVS